VCSKRLGILNRARNRLDALLIKRDQKGRPLAIGHRGASYYAAENSSGAFRLAADLGAEAVELDIQLSADGVCVVSHDDSVTLDDGRGLSIAKSQWSELRTVTISNGRTILSLDETIDIALERNLALYIESKTFGAGKAIWATLKRRDFESAVIGSFDVAMIKELRESGCDYPLSILVPAGAQPLKCASDSGADIVHLCWKRATLCPQELILVNTIQIFKEQGLEVILWNEERADLIADLVQLPVLGICSDRPEMLQHRLTAAPATVWHRGANKIVPENTVIAAKIAFGLGADYVEVDVRTTADNEQVILHDSTFDRTTNDHGAVAKRTLLSIQTVDVGIGFDEAFAFTALPTLQNMLDCARRNNGGLYIKLKVADARQVVQQVRGEGIIEKCFFWSQHPETLSELQSCGDNVRLMIRHQDYPDFEQALKEYRPSIVEFEGHRINHRDLESCRRAGCQYMAFIGDAKWKSFQAATASGADLINGDFSIPMLEYLWAKDSGVAVA